MADGRRRQRGGPEGQPDDEAYQQWVGQRVRALRAAAGLNQDDFSDVAGVQRSYVGLIEHGKRDLRVNTLRRIATAFGLDVHQLLDPGFEIVAQQLRLSEES